ncbi:Chlorovirus glycoprotein repeat domain-containing protein [Paramecium bursaria Chlorella virus CVG-1]|nr:Chlorovirus glycoprotein repeat domain-containing protein [Paramecium bursaria Chlorella virus CVG-1]
MSYFLTPWNNNFDEIYASGNIITEQYIIGNGAFITGATFTPPAVSSSDIRGNIIGSYANVSNIIANVGGNIANVRFTVDGNVTTSAYVRAGFFVGDGSGLTGITSTPAAISTTDVRGNIIGSYANVSNIIANVGGNIANVLFTMDGNVTTSAYINAGFFVGDGSGLTGITSTLPAIASTDVRGNIIGSYANVSNIISNVGGNIGNVVFLGGNVAASGQINVRGNVVSSFMIGDNRGNIIGSYANVSNIISNVGGNIGNVVFLGGNVAASGQINVRGNVVSSFMIGDNRGNIVGSYANVSNIISNVGGNIANVLFAMDGNVTTSAYIRAGFFVGDGSGLTGVTSTLPAISTTDVRGNIIGSYANVSNIISNVGGNIANVRFTTDGNVTTSAYIRAGFFVGDGSGLTGVTSTLPAISTTDVRGNIIGSYANVSNIISNVGGNIANVVFLGGNVAVSGQINVLGNVVSSFMIGDNRGNIIGSYANVSNIISNVGGNIGNVVFLGGNVAASGQINVLGNVVSSFMIGDNRGNIIGSYANVSNVFANVSINVFDNVGSLSTTANLFNSVSVSPAISDGWDHISCVTRGNSVFQLAGDGSFRSNVLSNIPLMNLYSTNVTYQDIMLHMLASRTPTPSFSFIECDVRDGVTTIAPFSVNGQGNVDSTSSISVLDGTSGAIRWRAANTGTMRANVSLNTFNLMNLHSTGATFSSTIVNLQTTRTTSSAFDFIDCLTNDGDTPVFIVNGLGNVTANGALTVDTGSSYGAAPLANNINSVSTSGTTGGHGHISCVTRGNTVFRVDVGGTITSNILQNVEVANLYATSAGFTRNVLSLQTLRGNSDAFNFINCSANDGADTQFSVNGTGGVKSINTNSGAPDVMNVTSLNTNFRGSLIKGYIAAGGYSAQQFISCANGTSGNVFTVNGLGNVGASGALTVDTGSSYGAAPLANNINSVSTSGTTGGHGHISCVTRGNTVFRVDVGGTITSNILQNVEVANLYATSAAFTRNVLSLQTIRGNSTAFNFIRCAANDGADPTLAINGLGGIRATTAVGSGIDDIHRFTNTNNAFRGALTRMNLNGPGYTGMQFITCTNDSAGNVFRVRGDGQIYASSNVISTNADYAEFFEWEDGNPMSEDRRCKTVTLVDDGKIRIARPEDDPLEIFGIVSAHPTIIGDAAWNEWSGKYIRNKFGDKTILNPEYDPTAGYIPREDRKEWDPIGLVGKLRVLPDQKVNPSWRFLRTITSDDGVVHEYLLTSGVNLGVMTELNSLKSELSTIKAHLGI